MAEDRTQEKGPAAYAQEAVSEWGSAARYGLRAVLARRHEAKHDQPPLRERLNPSRTDKGGRLGDAADLVLSKMGAGGKLASKGSLGSRVVERLRAGGEDDGPGNGAAQGSQDDDGNGLVADAPMPIQESMDVAVPLKTAFALCRDFEEYPTFLDHVERAERLDETHVAFLAKVRGRRRELEVELLDERPNERLDWQCSKGLEHSGVISFHPLAPRLTRLELTIEFDPRGLVERVTRRVHLTDRAVREELHRFKAYAELWEEPDEGDELDDEGEEYEVEASEDEALEDEEEFEDEEDLENEEDLEDSQDEEDFEDEEEFEDEEDFEDEELEEGELEPAASER